MVDASRNAIIRQVPATDGGLHVTDCPGDEPALVLMHGFPDDCRIYARLVPLLFPRRAVTFDFLGYGRSDRAQPGALPLSQPRPGYPPGRPVPQGGLPPDRRRISLATVGPTPGGFGGDPMHTLNIQEAGNARSGQPDPTWLHTARLRERGAR